MSLKISCSTGTAPSCEVSLTVPMPPVGIMWAMIGTGLAFLVCYAISAASDRAYGQDAAFLKSSPKGDPTSDFYAKSLSRQTKGDAETD